MLDAIKNNLKAKKIRSERLLMLEKFKSEESEKAIKMYNSNNRHLEREGRYYGLNDADTDIGDAKESLMARSRVEFQNNSTVRSAINRINSNVIGIGVSLKANFQNKILKLKPEQLEDLQIQIETLFYMWANSNECDFYREENFSKLQTLAMITQLVDGDCFVAPVYSYNKGDNFAFKIRLLDSASCQNPISCDGKDIKNGVEKDSNGVVTAYHFRKSSLTYETNRIQVYGNLTGRRNIFALMDKERIGQRRGVPLISCVLEILKDMGEYTQSELRAATINSYLAAFIENESIETKNQGPFKKDVGERNRVKIHSGSAVNLAPGQKITFPEMNRPNAGFTQFMNTMCNHIGAALGLAPELLLLKFSNNYSASKGALLESWKMLNMRRKWFVDDFIQPIYEEFVDYLVATRQIELPGYQEDILKRKAYLSAEWYGQPQGSLDPLKETKASVLKIQNNLSTGKREAYGINGSDIDKNIEQNKSENSKKDKDVLK